MFGRMRITSETTENGMEKFRKVLDEADTVIIGAGSGLSAAAGYTYSGERFNTYFSDFAEKYKRFRTSTAADSIRSRTWKLTGHGGAATSG